jgi:fucose permease
LAAVLRRPAVLLGAVLLAVYVGLEIAVGNWGYTYLVEERSVSGLLAGYTASGYWLGLTAGRFLMSSVTARLRLTQAGLMYACMVGTAVAGGLAWAAPGTAGLASAAFVLLGFFLGPVFPTMMAVTPRLAPERLVPTAIGVLSAGGLIGGSLFPWLAGTLLQVVGAWTLLPFAILLALAQLVLWWRVARRLAPVGASPVR